MKNIVVGIDFSDSSLNAMRHAVAISLRTKAVLHLAWVKTPGVVSGVNEDGDNNAFLQKANEKLMEWVKLCKQESPESEINSVVLEGKVHIAITSYAANFPECIIVMGTHGTSGFEEGYIGNNVYRLINMSKVPVLIMRPDIQIKRDLHKIMAPIDISFETLQKMRPSVELAKAFAAPIYLLGVICPIDPETKHVINVQLHHAANMCEQANVRYTGGSIETNTDACQTILKYAKDIDANLVVVMREESESDFSASSFTREILTTSPVPLMIIPNVNAFSVGR